MPPVLTNQATSQSIISTMMNNTLSTLGQPPIAAQNYGQDTDLRSVDPRLVDPRRPQLAGSSMDLDMRMMPNQMGGVGYDQRNIASSAPPQRQFPADPRQRSGNDPRDPRQKAQHQQQQQNSSTFAAQLHRGISNDASDQDKAALIMQVLKLTDEQIAILPPDQRTSILMLKEQIAKSANR